MRGALYAITEILVFLLIATVIGFFIGRWFDSLRGGGEPAAPSTESAPAPKASQDDSSVRAVEAELAAVRSRSEEVEKELSMARWQISTLEDELSKRPDSDEDA